FDADGRVAVVITQNRGLTQLFRNRVARPGLRVTLRGPPENPRGIGAMMRIQSGEIRGPARELRAGGGYWSQDGMTHVLSSLSNPEAVWVRWPGGMETTTRVENAREVQIAWPGRAE